MTLANKVTQFIQDSDKAHAIVHGDKNTVVQTEGGPVRSLAKMIADADAQLTELPSQVTGNPYRRRVAKALPIRFPGYAAVVAAKGYSYLFPQSFTRHGAQLFILYGAAKANDSNAGSFLAVYDWESGAYVSGFSFGTAYGEGLVIKTEGAARIMYARHANGILGKYDITQLPADQATLAPVATYENSIYSFLTWDGAQFTMQTTARTTGPSNPRNHFVRLDANLVFKSRLELDPQDAWSIEADLIPLATKLQGITSVRGGYVAGYGGTHYYGDAETPNRLCGIKVLSDAGTVLQSALMRPNAFIEILRAHGHTVDLVENEGLCAFGGKLYALWVTSSHTNQGNYGILITEELVGEIDCTPAATSTAPAPALSRLQGMIDQDDAGLKHPLTGALFTTVTQIIEFMRDTQLTRYGFYTTGSNIKDLTGTALPSGHFAEIVTGNFYSWLLTLSGASKVIRYWISGNEGALTQALQVNKAGVIDQSDTGIVDPRTGVLFTTLEQIIEFMRDTKTNRYAFYTTGSTLTDLTGAELPTGYFAEVITGNFISWEYTLRGTQNVRRFWITGQKGALVQENQVVRIGGTAATVGAEEVMLGISGVGQIATGVSAATARTHHAMRNPNGVVGLISTNGTSTTYATTSDERLKDIHGDVTGALALVRSMQDAGAIKMASFKADAKATPMPMFIAQRLREFAPWAVTEGHGEPGDEDFVPCMVDSSFLIPLLFAAIVELAPAQ